MPRNSHSFPSESAVEQLLFVTYLPLGKRTTETLKTLITLEMLKRWSTVLLFTQNGPLSLFFLPIPGQCI